MSKGYTNPALAAMGIKSLKLPSRNWMIFWSSLILISGGIVYDKYEQKQLRARFIKEFEKTGDEPFAINRLPRKLRIYIAPPPNDYLDESLKYLRRFVKPILNAAAIDFKIFTEQRQGDIRYAVAEEIRKIRREKLGLPDKLNEEQEAKLEETEEENGAAKLLTLTPAYALNKKAEPVVEEGSKNIKELYEPMDVLGISKLRDFKEIEKNTVYEDSIFNDFRESGGIICLGRGAYKEYINGVNEGLLGPLYEPKKLEETEKEDKEIKFEDDKAKNTEEEEEDKKNYAIQPFIYPEEYSNAELAPEIDLNHPVDKNGIPYFFVQPILVLRNYNVAGFTKQPERLYRFYNKRLQLIEYKEELEKLIHKDFVQYNKDDLNWDIEEEDDWPNSWKKKAIEKDSEWVRNFDCDSRVINLLSKYDVRGGEKENKENNENKDN